MQIEQGNIDKKSETKENIEMHPEPKKKGAQSKTQGRNFS